MSSAPLDHRLLAITGYTDRLSAFPGESIRVHASSIHESGSLQLMRLGHDGTHFTREAVSAPQSIELAHRNAELGSYGIVDSVNLPAAPFTLCTWVWVSLLPSRAAPATLLAFAGLSLTLDATGTVTFGIDQHKVNSNRVLLPRRWYQVSGGLDADRRPFLMVRAQHAAVGETEPERTVGLESVAWQARSGALIFGRDLNGKLEEVCITGSGGGTLTHTPLRLDFARGITTWLVHDDQGNPVGRVAGMPTRAARGRHWDGSEHAWRHAVHQYAAIHFHTDDQGDQRWPVTATVDLPADLTTGVYAIALSAGGEVDYLPFVVRRKHGAPASLLLVLPTLTYQAYALWHLAETSELCMQFARANGYHSLYDTHADSSPVVLASLRRPLLNVRPDHLFENLVCHGLSADLHLVGWLIRQGFDFDVATDHDLDAAGVSLLSPYRAVLTGQHPEYVTARMLDALQGYIDRGGNLAYLGGNGFYWAATIDPDDASIAELRRGPQVRFSPTGSFAFRLEGDVGEEHFQLTGAPGGLWNTLGRPVGALVGVTHAWGSVRAGHARPYRRTPASRDPRVAHLFAGIGDEEIIGERGAFFGAAASFEVDFAHHLLGTPAHALVVATAEMPEGSPLESVALPVIQAVSPADATRSRHADLTYFETASGGAVFSVGSMGWIGALSHDGDRNAASRLTANALRGFKIGRESP